MMITNSHSSSSTGSGNLSQSLFDAYGLSFCTADHNSYGNSELASSWEEDNPLEQQLYQAYMEMDSQNLPEQWQHSSSSSSRRSLSMGGSPEQSSLQCNHTSTSPSRAKFHPSISRRDHQIQFPTPKNEDLAITRAMLAIFSTPTPSSSTLNQPQKEMYQSGFNPYNSASVPVYESKEKSCSQKMIKNSISILRRIDLTRGDGESLPSSHVMSERKRREKLNGSFHTLGMLLPSGYKKDKASVLCKTKDYIKTLKAQIFELEEKNQMLERHLFPTDDAKEGIVQIIEASEQVRGVKRIDLRIAVIEECDLIELVLSVLECLRRMKIISLVSVDAKTCLRKLNLFTWAKLKFDIKASDWDEAALKEAISREVHMRTIQEIHNRD